ncbi:PAS domain S-box protein, partial [Thermodesulfobacteriota bacterium]
PPERITEVLAPEDRAKAKKDFRQLRKGEKVKGVEYRLLKHDGTTVPVVSFIAPVKRDDGFIGARGVAVDISDLKRMQEALGKAKNELESRVRERTSELEEANEKLRREIAERKRSDEALRSSEEKYRQLVENASEAIIVAQDGKLKIANPTCIDWTGRSEEELTSMPFTDLLHPDDRETVKKYHARRMEGAKDQVSCPVRILDKDGNVRLVDLSAGPIDWEGRPAALCLLTDITGRLRAEEALRKSEEKYRSIIDYMEDAYFEVDLAGNMVFFNDATCRILGYPRDELVGMNNRHFMDEATAKTAFRTFNRVFRTGESTTLSGWQVIRKDGTRRILETQISLIRDALDNPSGFRGFSRDVTATKKAEAALRESEAKYRAIIENIEEGYYEVDIAGNMRFCNDAMCKILGYSRDELIGMNNRKYMDESTSEQVFRTFNMVFKTGEPATVPGWRLITKEGGTKSIETSISLIRDSDGKPDGFRGIVRDVTERERVQMQSVQAQKMQAIGTLAGGIAHDFNNILQAIMGFTELSLEEVPEGSGLHSNLQIVLNGGERANDLVNQILTFSRQSRQERRPVEVVPIVKEGVKFLRASLPSTIEIRQVIEPELRSVVADPTEIHQILMNLCTNASHAMRRTGGVLEIDLENVSVDQRSFALDPQIEPGSYLRMTVSDTGTGMGADTIQRIFEPYFSTKEKGEGTGLGLAVVHGIVTSYGGVITVQSEVDQGSTFRIYLPSAAAEPKREVDTDKPIPAGSEKILYVDDEPAIVRMATQMLGRLGYGVTSLTSSLDALELFRARPKDFDLVITDMTMPNLTGLEFAQEVRLIRSNIPLILCTGFSELITEDKIESLGISDVVLKPIRTKDMAEAIRRVLEE